MSRSCLQGDSNVRPPPASDRHSRNLQPPARDLCVQVWRPVRRPGAEHHRQRLLRRHRHRDQPPRGAQGGGRRGAGGRSRAGPARDRRRTGSRRGRFARVHRLDRRRHDRHRLHPGRAQQGRRRHGPRGLLQRRRDPLGRSRAARRPGVRLREPDRGRPGDAVRLQLRPRRHVPDGRPRRPLPAHRQPRVHHRADDVPRLRLREPDP